MFLDQSSNHVQQHRYRPYRRWSSYCWVLVLGIQTSLVSTLVMAQSAELATPATDQPSNQTTIDTPSTPTTADLAATQVSPDADLPSTAPVASTSAAPANATPNMIQRLWQRFRPQDDETQDSIPTEPPIDTQIEGAPADLESNVRAYLKRLTISELRDFRDNLPRIRTLAREAAYAVGYYNAQFRFAPIDKNTLKVQVDAGEPVYLRTQRIIIRGEGDYDSAFIAAKQQPEIKLDDQLNHAQYEATKARLNAVAIERGYFDGVWEQHDIVVTLPDNTADMSLVYQSGQRYRFGEVRFEPMVDGEPLPVQEKWLRTLVPFAATDFYDASQIAQLSRALIDTRWFNNIEVEAVTPEPLALLAKQVRAEQAIADAAVDDAGIPPPSSAPLLDEQGVAADQSESPTLTQALSEIQAQRDLARRTQKIPVRVRVDARRPNSAETGIGYGTDTGLRLRTQYRRALVNDKGHSVDANLELSEIRQAMDARYTTPYKHPLNDTISYVGGIEREMRQAGNGTDLQTQALTFGVERAIKPRNGDWQHTFSLRYRVDELENDTISGINAADLPEPFNISGVSFTQQALLAGYGANKVYTRGGVDPVEGFRQYYQVEVGSESLLTDTNMAILRAGWRGIYSAGATDQHQWVGRLDLGTIASDGFSQVPYNLRFFAGGDQSIRGFDYKSLGAEQEGFLIGGQHLAVGSMEYNYKFLPKWRGAVFVDAGNAFDDQFNDPIKVGAGLGIRWSSPVGPIRIDVAAGISETSVPIRLHFFIGPPL